jgi:ATP-dependent Lon protease
VLPTRPVLIDVETARQSLEIQAELTMGRESQYWWSQVSWPEGVLLSFEDTYKRRSQESESSDEPIEAPLLPLRDMVMFPRMVTPLAVERDRSIAAIDAAKSQQEQIIAVAQRDSEILAPAPEDLFTFGVETGIGRTMRLPDGSVSTLAQGLRRVQIVEYLQLEPYIRVRALPISETTDTSPLTEALMRAVLALFEKIVELDEGLPEEAYVFALNIDDPSWLADLMVQGLSLDIDEREEVLETVDPARRLQRVSVLLAKELEVLELESHIQSEVQQELDKIQREYFLREKLKVIQSELGEQDGLGKELGDLRRKIEEAKLPEEAGQRVLKEVDRLGSTSPMSPEASVIRTYVDWLLELPWSKTSDDNLDIGHVEHVLESNHYGLPKAKERILEHIAVRKMAADKMRSPILCFVGPPGTGKTSLGQSIAGALGREFVRVSLGGVRDEAEIRGHRRTYIGALPGRIIQTMRRAGTINPVFMLDEVDKLGLDFRGDPAAALLEVLDPEQNHSFSDHYLEVPYDLSKVLFITTANLLGPIPPALQDRMEVIEFPGYVDHEKLEIAKRFLIPRQLEEHGLQDMPLSFTDGALQSIIGDYTYEAGVRNLDRCIATICRKVDRRMAEGSSVPRRITANTLAKFLGSPEFIRNVAEQEDGVGIATGVAWTEGGGDLTPVEVALMPGKGTLMLTGQLGDIMQESAQAALSYTRSRAEDFGIQPDVFEQTDIHIHFPEGAIPKDGPSAGITITTALVSALTDGPVRHDVGMTGEITLRGRVLPVGGLKEKMMAAYRAGLKTIIIPRRNKKDLSEVPGRVQKRMRIILVDQMDEVLKEALIDRKPRHRRTSRQSLP